MTDLKVNNNDKIENSRKTLINPEQILVVVDFSRASESAILHGLEMAKIFRRGLSLLHVCNSKSHKLFENYSKEAAAKRLFSIAAIVQEQNPDVIISSIVLDGKLTKTIYDTAEDINAIMVVLGLPIKSSGQIRRAGQVVRIMRNSRIPYLIVREEFPIKDGYKKIVLPLDETREYKEKVLWASYFSRFYDSEINILMPKSNDAELIYRINANKRFTDKLFDDFEVKNSVHDTNKSVYDMNEEGFDFAAKKSSQLVIIMNTAFYNMFDYLTGPPEQKLINNKYYIPVLCINPRDDLYVMCV